MCIKAEFIPVMLRILFPPAYQVVTEQPLNRCLCLNADFYEKDFRAPSFRLGVLTAQNCDMIVTKALSVTELNKE